MNDIDKETGLPNDKSYLEEGLPPYLEESLKKYKEGEAKVAANIGYMRFDCDYCELQSSINVAEVDGRISSESAWHLREKYLGIAKP